MTPLWLDSGQLPFMRLARAARLRRAANGEAVRAFRQRALAFVPASLFG